MQSHTRSRRRASKAPSHQPNGDAPGHGFQWAAGQDGGGDPPDALTRRDTVAALAGSSLAKTSANVEIVSARRSRSVEQLRAKLEADALQEWANGAVDGDEEEDEPRELPPFTVVGENTGEWGFSDGGFFKGQWTDGAAHGLGRRRNVHDGWEYAGLWMNGVFAGTGVLYRLGDGGEAYAGDWHGGQRSGFGVETAPDHVFAGTWARAERGRFGALDSGEFGYMGSFHESQPHGVGKETDAEGGVYLGQFAHGHRHGFGVWVASVEEGRRSARYEGAWERDRREGHGVMRYALSGNVYRGEWRGQRRHGYGVLTDADDRVLLSGIWSDDDLESRRGTDNPKVEEAVAEARRAASAAREHSRMASQTARVAADKVDRAELAAAAARQMAARASEEWSVYEAVKTMPSVDNGNGGAAARTGGSSDDPFDGGPPDVPFDDDSDATAGDAAGKGGASTRRRWRGYRSSRARRSSSLGSDKGEGCGWTAWAAVAVALLLLFAFSEDLAAAAFRR